MSDSVLTINLQDLNYNKNLLINYTLSNYSNFNPDLTQNLSEFSLENNNSFSTVLINFEEEKQEKNFLDQLDDLHTDSYKINSKLNTFEKNNINYKSNLQNYQKEEINSINKSLAGRDWAIILTNDSSKLASTSYEEFASRSKEKQEEGYSNWQQEFYANVTTWLETDAANFVDDANEAFKTAQNALSEYQSFVSKYIVKNSILTSTASSILGTLSNASSQISNVLKSSSSSFGTNSFRTLRDSVLSYFYLTKVKTHTVDEVIDLTGMTFIKAKNPKQIGGYGQTLLPFKTTNTTLTFSESLLIAKFNLKTSPVSTNSDKNTPEKIYTYQKAGLRANALHDIVTHQDFQTQYYLAYFTKIVNGEESLMKIYIKTTDKTDTIEDVTLDKNLNATFDNQYYYYFYTDSFDFKPVKKVNTNIQYGYQKANFALDTPEGKNTFSFNIPADLELTFWNFITRNGLGVNSDEAYYSNNIKNPVNDGYINLNFIFNQQTGDLTTTKNILVDRFVLENINFNSIKNLEFTHTFKQMKLGVSGVYNKLKWYHNQPLSEV